MNKQELKESLKSKEGFKRIARPFLIFFGRAKKSYEIYHTAEETDILDAKLLARYEYEENKYLIITYSTKGEIASEKLNELKQKAEQFELGTVRFNAAGSNGLSLWRGDWNFTPNEVNEISELGNQDEGIYVEVVADSDKNYNNVPYVVYALKDNKRYFCPVLDYYLN